MSKYLKIMNLIISKHLFIICLYVKNIFNKFNPHCEACKNSIFKAVARKEESLNLRYFQPHDQRVLLISSFEYLVLNQSYSCVVATDTALNTTAMDLFYSKPYFDNYFSSRYSC